MEENAFSGNPIDRHQHQSPNVEDNDTDTITYWQQDIVEIEPTSSSDSEGADAGRSSEEGTTNTYNEVVPTILFINIIIILLLFYKLSLLFIVSFITYLSIE